MIGITGAASAIGQAVTKEVESRGLVSIGLVRRPKELSERLYDLHERPTQNLLEGLNAVIHLAWDWDGSALAAQINSEAGIALAKLCASTGVRPVLLSTMSVFAGRYSAYGSEKGRVEDAFASAEGNSLRAGLIWGGDQPFGMVATIKTIADLPYICPHLQPDPLLFQSELEAVARLLVDAATPTLEFADSAILVAASKEALRLSEITHSFARRGRKWHLSVPQSLVRQGARHAERLGLPLPFRPDSFDAIGSHTEAAVEASGLPWLQGLPGKRAFKTWLSSVGTNGLRGRQKNS